MRADASEYFQNVESVRTRPASRLCSHPVVVIEGLFLPAKLKGFLPDVIDGRRQKRRAAQKNRKTNNRDKNEHDAHENPRHPIAPPGAPLVNNLYQSPTHRKLNSRLDRRLERRGHIECEFGQFCDKTAQFAIFRTSGPSVEQRRERIFTPERRRNLRGVGLRTVIM